ncbi:methyltransferase domain-containing protein [Altererythrobacter soli]|uniref:Methyltransferase domain-containing protein n=1 Tax=Croceibacterium soli TaxID=1739690 RepID=A0A6I4UXE4_9SPHN|nr:methyltransferase domain-containing protein [Croceibacterium soli]MXP42439.1 methyltransferase domain-containing protein [Croceibacterium soli]
MMRKSVLTASFVALAVATCNPVNAQTAATETIAAAVADGQRPAQDKARDGERKPAEIVAFAGVEPGDVIAEIAPGGGYYTRILAKAVGPTGKVYALVPPFFANRPGGLDGINALAAQYPNVKVVVADYAALDLPEPADLVWTTENYHDIANGDIAAINREVFEALKPGGIYFVEDHSAPGTGMAATSTLHRIDPAAVKQQVAAAGFTLEAESDLLHNPADPHDVSPREVEPTSDKFALRFRKPG